MFIKLQTGRLSTIIFFYIYIMYPLLKKINCQLYPFSDEQWQELEQRHTVKKFKRGEHLIKESRVCEAVSFICQGIFVSYFKADTKKGVRFFYRGKLYFRLQKFSYTTACYYYCSDSRRLWSFTNKPQTIRGVLYFR